MIQMELEAKSNNSDVTDNWEDFVTSSSRPSYPRNVKCFLSRTYCFSHCEMRKAASLEKVNKFASTEILTGTIYSYPDDCYSTKKTKLRCEHYWITINRKIRKSNSLTDFSSSDNDHDLNFKHKDYKLSPKAFYESAGDTEESSRNKQKDVLHSYMFHSNESKKNKNVINQTYARKGSEFSSCSAARHSPKCISPRLDYVTSSCSEQTLLKKREAFPFKTTPSGNLKIRTSQVVFQSSTVGVLLADPAQAKVKVKFEGKSAAEQDNQPFNDSLHVRGPQENIYMVVENESRNKAESPEKYIDEKGENLNALGYAVSEPIDWLRVQLPKKQDLYQEFFRRIHNFINTDTVVHIGNERFNCHRIVLQIYSSYFDSHPKREIELPSSSITPAAFKAIYEWMTSNGEDCYRILKRRNILDLFTAAQFLAIKDLEEQCWSFMLNDSLFTEDTAFALLREAKAKKINPVVELMVPRVMRFFLPLVASSDFLELNKEELLILLNSNSICVTSELEVLMAGVRWLYSDWNSRSKHVADVARCVRFGLISPWQLVDLKRNPENAEILDVVNTPEVQEMIDDGLAYVIIKYWYGTDSKNYQHWIDVLGLKEPAERNWIGEERNHVTYVEFLKYVEQFRMPKDQMYQKMAMMQLPRRSEVASGQRGATGGKEMRRLKMDFPLPDTLKKLTCEGSFPNMSQFFESKMKDKYLNPKPPFTASPNKTEIAMRMNVTNDHNMNMDSKTRRIMQKNNQALMLHSLPTRNTPRNDTAPNDVDGANTHGNGSTNCTSCGRDCNNTTNITDRQTSSIPADCSAVFLGRENKAQDDPGDRTPVHNVSSDQISVFDRSKESSPNFTKNKLSKSILGPSNRNYISDGSLFNWDKETVLVFGGTDPHSPYHPEGNSGRDIYRFDPVLNKWDWVGELPEPRHHHSVAFLRGKVYLVGGADPRHDEEFTKSAVLSTTWCFDPARRSWSMEPALGVPRKSFGLVAHRLALYAIGGQDRKGRVLRSVERFDPKTRCWREVRPMGEARMGPATAKCREHIWVAGGMTGDRQRPVSSAVECYNSKTNQWTEIYSLRFPRCFSSLCAVNNTLYLIGGAGRITENINGFGHKPTTLAQYGLEAINDLCHQCDGNVRNRRLYVNYEEKTTSSGSSMGCIDVWHWKDRGWRPLAELAVARHGHALAYLGTQLIVIGGVTTIYMQALSDVESYCCERSAWIRGVASLPTPLSGHDAVTLPPASLM